MKRELKTKKDEAKVIMANVLGTKPPDVVYKYRVWTCANHRRIITNGEVFMSKPSSFPDQTDCRSRVKYLGLNQQELYFIYYHYFEYRYPSWNKKKRDKKVRKRMKNSPLKDEIYVAQKQDAIYAQFNNRVGVLSLSENPIRLKMWEDYADNHRGFAVGFDTSVIRDLGFTAIGNVQYYDTLPTLYPEPINSYDEQLYLQIFAKLNKYDFEEEFRAFVFREKCLADADRKIILPPEAFKEIIIGAQMPKNVQCDLLNNIPSELKNVPIEYADISKMN
jgi:hypothetical protein